MNDVELSIIIPVFNLEDYITKTLDSIENSSFSFGYEVLIINDGSTDNSVPIIEKYINGHSGIKLVSISNSGVSNARNVGLKMAKGDYITFVDGDDAINGAFFEYGIERLKKGGVDLIQGNYIKIKDGKELAKEQFVREEKLVNSFHDMIDLFVGGKKEIHNAVWGKIYSRKLIDELSFDVSLKIAEDQKFVFDCLKRSSGLVLSNQVAYYYTLRGTSAMANISLEKIENNIQVCEYIESFIGYNQDIITRKMRNIIEAYNCSLLKKNDVQKMKYRQELSLIRKDILCGSLTIKEKIITNMIIHVHHLYDFIKG